VTGGRLLSQDVSSLKCKFVPVTYSFSLTVFFPMIVHSIFKDFVSILKQRNIFSNFHFFLSIVLIHLYVNL
jgi:hypothetical protein